MLETIAQNLQRVQQQIADAERRFEREAGSVELLAVSKGQPIEKIEQALLAGQRAFGENYLQEAAEKIEAIKDDRLHWHFIGAIQSNKTAAIARLFDWVHCVDRLKIAKRLSDQRPADLAPLNLCLEVNISEEASKSGVALSALEELALVVDRLPRLRLRGLMVIPAPESDFEAQRKPFHLLAEVFHRLKTQGLQLDTLSMGMSADFKAAIAEGSTIVRIGTALFGPRHYPR